MFFFSYFFYLMNFNLWHFVVARGNNTGNPRINVNHNEHWDEEGPHCWEYHISFILVVTTLQQIPSARFVPVLIFWLWKFNMIIKKFLNNTFDILLTFEMIFYVWLSSDCINFRGILILNVILIKIQQIWKIKLQIFFIFVTSADIKEILRVK